MTRGTTAADKTFEVEIMVHRREFYRVEANDAQHADEIATERAHEKAKEDGADVRDFFLLRAVEVTKKDEEAQDVEDVRR